MIDYNFLDNNEQQSIYDIPYRQPFQYVDDEPIKLPPVPWTHPIEQPPVDSPPVIVIPPNIKPPTMEEPNAPRVIRVVKPMPKPPIKQPADNTTPATEKEEDLILGFKPTTVLLAGGGLLAAFVIFSGSDKEK